MTSIASDDLAPPAVVAPGPADPVDAEDLDGPSPRVPVAVRVRCPECGAAVRSDAGRPGVPEHAVAPSPSNPFGVTVCPGSGAAVDSGTTGEASAEDGGRGAEDEVPAPRHLPPGLDWRNQPFSHSLSA